jgi:hypothetical protein
MGHSDDADTFLKNDDADRVGEGISIPMGLVLLYLLVDRIYPSRHPIVTSFSSAQLRHKPENIKRHKKKINIIRRC